MGHQAKVIFVGDPGEPHVDATRAVGLSVEIHPADDFPAEKLDGGDILVVSAASCSDSSVLDGLIGLARGAGLPVLVLGQVDGADVVLSDGSLEMLDIVDAATSPENLATRIQLHVEGRRLRSELADRNSELAAANERLQSLIDMRDNVLSVASHDLKTPVTTLKLFSDLIRSGALVDGEFHFGRG